MRPEVGEWEHLDLPGSAWCTLCRVRCRHQDALCETVHCCRSHCQPQPCVRVWWMAVQWGEAGNLLFIHKHVDLRPCPPAASPSPAKHVHARAPLPSHGSHPQSPKPRTPPHPHTLSADHGWSEMADFIAGESMPTSAYSGGLVAVYNRLYYTGGYVGSDAVKRYRQPSPASGWTTVGAMPSLASDGNQNAAASGEYLYMSESGFANSRYTRYTASTDSWTSGKPPRSPRA